MIKINGFVVRVVFILFDGVAARNHVDGVVVAQAVAGGVVLDAVQQALCDGLLGVERVLCLGGHAVNRAARNANIHAVDVAIDAVGELEQYAVDGSFGAFYVLYAAVAHKIESGFRVALTEAVTLNCKLS